MFGQSHADATLVPIQKDDHGSHNFKLLSSTLHFFVYGSLTLHILSGSLFYSSHNDRTCHRLSSHSSLSQRKWAELERANHTMDCTSWIVVDACRRIHRDARKFVSFGDRRLDAMQILLDSKNIHVSAGSDAPDRNLET